MINSRFAVAVHVLTLLAFGHERYPDVPMTSEMAAESVNTNPVVVRRILGQLRNAGIVSSQSGPRGGWLLERDPGSIRLDEVYRSVEDEQLFSLHHRAPSRLCTVGSNIQSALGDVFKEAEEAMAAKLAQRTVSDMLEAIRARVQCEQEAKDQAG